MARCAESGEKDSEFPFSDEIVVCFVHVCISQTVTRFPFLDKDAASFLSGAMEKATSTPRLSCCSMQEADSRSKTRIDPPYDPTTSRFWQVNASDNTTPYVSRFFTDLSVAPADQTCVGIRGELVSYASTSEHDLNATRARAWESDRRAQRAIARLSARYAYPDRAHSASGNYL